MSIKKISINQLRVGMHIVGIDIPWIRSPFLKHSRAIDKANDIKLLIQAGVKEVSIDVEKSIIKEESKEESKVSDDEQVPLDNKVSEKKVKEVLVEKVEEVIENKSFTKDTPINETTVNETIVNDPPINESKPIETNKPQPTLLSEELEQANFLKDKASEAFTNLSETIKQNKVLDLKEVSPIVDDSIQSLLRNNQALLSLMHMHRNEKDLFSHSFSVMSLLLSLAISLDYTDDQLKNFGIAALLHDLGWARIPLHLLSKNKKYSENELKVIQQHLAIIIRQLSSDPQANKEAIQLISEHHEKGDGTGYPKGLFLKDLTHGSSLLMLVDHYDELIHGLSDYAGAIPSLALKMIYKDALQGIHDKKEVEQLINLLGIYPLTSAIKLSSGEKAVVIEVNRARPLSPKVKVFYNAKGVTVPEPFIIDLANDEKERKIKQVVDVHDIKQDPMQLLSSKCYKDV